MHKVIYMPSMNRYNISTNVLTQQTNIYFDAWLTCSTQNVQSVLSHC